MSKKDEKVFECRACGSFPGEEALCVSCNHKRKKHQRYVFECDWCECQEFKPGPCCGIERGLPKPTLVVNLFGGPGTGKSTTAAALFAELKYRGVNCEIASEYAKDKVWEKSTHTLDNQLYVFGKQHHRIWRLIDQVDVVITDSPLLLSLYYGNEESDAFHSLVREEHCRLRTYNVFLIREKAYNTRGRLQSEEQAKSIDTSLLRILDENGVQYDRVHANREAARIIADMVYPQI